MAKKDLIPVETLTSTINIDKNDLLAIAVSRAETHMLGNFAAAKKEVKRLEAAAKTDETTLNNALDALSKASVADIVQKLNDIATMAKSNLTITTSWTKTGDGKTGDGIVTIVTVKNDDNGYNSIAVAKVVTKHSRETAGLAKTLAETKAGLAAARDTAVDWQKRLAQIPALERKYRANLAEATLKKTEQGQALLEALGNSFQQDVLLLPGA